MKKLKYDEAIKKLEALVVKLEKGDCSLEETIKLYDEATKLSGYCTAMLDNAKIKIEELSEKKENSDE